MAKEITKKIDANELLQRERVKSLVDLWYETQMGCMHKCMRKQHEFQDLMWGLYEEFNGEDDE